MRLLAALAFLLLAAAPAQADPFGELPYRQLSGVATCLRPTGVPGELTRWTKDGFELLRADDAGLTATGEVRLGESLNCAEVAGRPNGAAIAAVVARGKDGYVVRATVRDPGQGFGVPVTLELPRMGELDQLRVVVAIAPNGDALVAARQNVLLERSVHVIAFRRPSGGAFLAPQDVTGARRDVFPTAIGVGVDAAGGFTLAWTRTASERSGVLETATAPAGGPFGAVKRIGPAGALSSAALRVAPDGRALVAYMTDDAVAVAERAPGAASFAERVAIGGGAELTLTAPAIALADDGAAAVAWRSGDSEFASVQVASRAGPGAFNAAREVAPARDAPETPIGDGGNEGFALYFDGPRDARDLQAAVSSGGFVFAWPGRGAEVATGAFAGGGVTRASLGSPVRGAESIAPVTLADGRTAIALADDDSGFGGFASGHGRLQLALPGIARPASAPPPRIDIPRLERQRRYRDEAVELPIRCSGPCDVSATAGVFKFAVRSRATAGPLSLPLELAPVVHGFVPVTLTVATPGSRASATRHVRVPVTWRRSLPVPKPLDLRVKKDGGDLIVTWRTAFAARRTLFAVRADGKGVLPLASKGVNGAGKRSFRVRLKDAAQARRVGVIAYGESDRRPRTASVRLR
jgi:hypothetical protein